MKTDSHFRSPTHALYPGSFDVLTYGHLDVLRRASQTFSKVTVAVTNNPSKHSPLFTVEERVEMLSESLAQYANVSASSFQGLTVHFANEIGATMILRGLRAVSDFEFELQMAMMNETLSPGITTIFMAPSPQYSFLSSSLVKEVARFGGNVADLVPPAVEKRLLERLRS